MEKLLIIGLFIFGTIGTINAANFYISPEYSSFASKCETAVDIMIDGEGSEVAAADMVLLFNTGEILPLCFIPGDFLNVGGGMEIEGNKIKVTSYQYPGYAKGKGKFGTLIFRPFSTVKETTLYFDVKKLGIKETAGDSNISKPGGGDLLNKAGFAKYLFEEGTCQKIDKEKLKSCKIYDNSGSFDTFIQKYKKEVKTDTTNYTRIIIRSILLFAIFIIIIIRFTNKKNQAEGKE